MKTRAHIDPGDFSNLDQTWDRISKLSGEIDNVYTDVRYRAPMAELAYLGYQLVLEVERLRGYLREAVDLLDGSCGCTGAEVWHDEFSSYCDSCGDHVYTFQRAVVQDGRVLCKRCHPEPLPIGPGD